MHDNIVISASLATSGLRIQIFGEATGDAFGNSVSACDVNDITIGATMNNPGSKPYAGAVYLIFGQIGLSSDIYASSLSLSGMKIKGENS